MEDWIWAVWDDSEPDREDSAAEVTQSLPPTLLKYIFVQVDDGSEYDSDESGEGSEDEGMGEEEEEEEDLEFEEN